MYFRDTHQYRIDEAVLVCVYYQYFNVWCNVCFIKFRLKAPCREEILVIQVSLNDWFKISIATIMTLRYPDVGYTRQYSRR